MLIQLECKTTGILAQNTLENFNFDFWPHNSGTERPEWWDRPILTWYPTSENLMKSQQWLKQTVDAQRGFPTGQKTNIRWQYCAFGGTQYSYQMWFFFLRDNNLRCGKQFWMQITKYNLHPHLSGTFCGMMSEKWNVFLNRLCNSK